MRSLLSILVASVVLPLALFIGISAYDRARILEDAEESLRRTTDILHEHALRLLEIQDLVIRQVDRRIAGLSWEEIGRSEEVHRFLRDLDQGLEYVDAIWLTHPDGVTVQGSQHFPALRIDAGGREHFTTLRDGATDLVMSRPFIEKLSKEPFIVVARRRTASGGVFDGLIAVSIKAEKLLQLYRGAAPHLNHAVGLIRSDGAFLIRDAALPPPDGAAPLAGQSFHRAIAARPDAGTFTGVSAVDGVRRMAAYRKIGKYPVYVALAAGTGAVLAEWRRHVLIYGLLCGGAGISLFLMTLLAWRQAAREREALVRLEQEAARRELAESALRQSQKLEAIGKLTGGIAHDFNNMLTAIIGSLETIRSRAGRTDVDRSDTGRSDIAGPLDIALQGANRAATLTQRLLAFARQQPLNPRPEDLNALVSGMSELLRRSLGEAVVLETELAAELWLTSCDPVQMETALLNLAINARDAMPDGGRLRVRTANVALGAGEVAAIGELEPGEYVRLVVSDTGTGMPEDVRARAFDPFFTTKPVGQGTGLGLSQVYGIVRQSGGNACIRSVPGEGTSVEIYLPRHHAGAGAGASAPPAVVTADDMALPVAGPAGNQSGGPPRVLLVEDEAIVRFVAVEALRGAGYEVEEAEDATAALTLIEGPQPFDLMVTDVGLPGLNGRQLAEMARRLRPCLKIIYMTGYAGIAADVEFEPGTLLLPKPFTPDALVRKVGQTLARSDATPA